MNWAERRKKFRAILAGDKCLRPAPVFDPMSARIAEEIGYDLLSFAGSVASFTILAAPDLCVLTLSEFAEQIYRINRATSLPLLVDADHGYGNALNVMRTVEELETFGVSALSIEDTLLPARYGAASGVELISIEEGVGKMDAALAARRDASLAIVARTSAMAISSTEEAISRITAYAETGVDAIFLVGVKTRAQLDGAAAAVSVPFVLGNIAPDLLDLDYLSQRRVRILLQGHAPFRAAISRIYEVLSALHDGAAPEVLGQIASPDLIGRLTHEEEYQRRAHAFLGGMLGPRE